MLSKTDRAPPQHIALVVLLQEGLQRTFAGQTLAVRQSILALWRTANGLLSVHS